MNAPIFKTDQGTSAKDTNTQMLQNTGDTPQDEQNPIALKNQNKEDVDQHLLLRKLVSLPSDEETWKKVQQILNEELQMLQKDGVPLTNPVLSTHHEEECATNQDKVSTSPTPRYTWGTSDKLNYKETKEVLNKLYTDTSPHKDSKGKSDNKKEDIKHEEGENLKLKLTPDNSSCQNPDGKFPDIT